MTTDSETTRVSANIRQRTDGVLICVHCDATLPGSADTVLALLPRYEGPPATAGPHIFGDPSEYVDAEVIFRQYYCPGCWTAFHSEVVPQETAGTATLTR